MIFVYKNCVCNIMPIRKNGIVCLNITKLIDLYKTICYNLVLFSIITNN